MSLACFLVRPQVVRDVGSDINVLLGFSAQITLILDRILSFLVDVGLVWLVAPAGGRGGTHMGVRIKVISALSDNGRHVESASFHILAHLELHEGCTEDLPKLSLESRS